MDDRYIKIRKDILWKIIAIFITIILVGLLIFQIYSRTDKNKSSEYAPVEYVDVTYDHLTSKLTDSSQCYICGNHEMSLMPYYRKFDTIGILSLNDCYVVDLGLKEYDEVGNERSNSDSTSIRTTTQNSISYQIHSTSSRGMASAEIELQDDYKLDTSSLEKKLCSDCLSKVTNVLAHSYRKGEEKKETIPLCIIDFETLDVYSLQDYYRSYFVRDYWVELDFFENRIDLSAYYLPVRK